MAQPPAIAQRWTFFAVVQEPCRQRPTTRPPLQLSRTITMLATIGGAQPWVEIAS
jgi:hypothetical protein